MTNQLMLFPSADEFKMIGVMAESLAKTPFYQKLTPGGVLAIIMCAREMNLPPMFALNGGLINISGRVTASASAINMMLVRGGVKVKPIKWDDEGCKCSFTRNGETVEFEYKKEEARIAGYLGKDNWVKQLRPMLFCRCISGAARVYYPDILGNVYVAGECGPEDSHIMPDLPQVDYEFIEPETPKPPETPKILTISDDQIKHLMYLMRGCDPLFYESVFLKKLEQYKIESMNKVPLAMYKNMEAFIIKSRDEFISQSSLTENDNSINE